MSPSGRQPLLSSYCKITTAFGENKTSAAPESDALLSAIKDFIETPTQNCKNFKPQKCAECKECKAAVDQIIAQLGKDPKKILDILTGDPFLPPIYYLDELFDKMNMQKSLEKLGTLFDKHLDALVESCIHNPHDLKRCTEAMPAYTDALLENIFKHPPQLQRLFEAERDPQDTLATLTNRYKNFQARFVEAHTRLFSAGAPVAMDEQKAPSPP